MCEMKKIWNGINGRLNIAKEKIKKLESIAVHRTYVKWNTQEKKVQNTKECSDLWDQLQAVNFKLLHG